MKHTAKIVIEFSCEPGSENNLLIYRSVECGDSDHLNEIARFVTSNLEVPLIEIPKDFYVLKQIARSFNCDLKDLLKKHAEN